MNEHADTPARLIEAARKAFGDKGFDAASVREITAAAHANLGAVTYHFGSKDALYEAVVDHVFDLVATRLRAALEGAAGQPPLDRIETLLREAFAAIRDNPDFQFLILSQAVLKHRPPAAALRQVPELLALLARTIGEGQADGSIRAGDPRLMAISVVSQPAYFGIVVLLLLPRLPALAGPHPSWDAITEHAVSFVRAGLASEAS